MAGVFLSNVAPEAPPIEVSPFPGIQSMTWTSWDGTAWDLLSPASVFLGPGVGGLNAPQITRFTQVSPALAGARYLGHRVEPRGVFWPLYVYSDLSSVDWLQHDRAIWRSLHPDKPGRWTVVSADGVTRSLLLRFLDDSDHVADKDAQMKGWEVYGINLVADQPFWEGALIERAWAAGDTREFYSTDASDTGEVFCISSGNTLAAAQLTNPGDEPAWPTWRLTGPCTSATVGVDGHDVQVPIALANGEQLVIDTSPAAQTAIKPATGEDVTHLLGETDFAPLPASGKASQLDLTLNGTGSIAASFTPLYRRAW